MNYQNETEEFIAEICGAAFLSLWSIPNPYTDEGITKNRIGKELCDLVVVFDKSVILFSVKHRSITSTDEVSWKRWYRKTITKSVDQLYGAEAWVRRYPARIFYDKECKNPIDLFDSATSAPRIHRIAVSLGSVAATRNYYGSQSGTLVINTSISGDEHLENPFNIGLVGERERFIHVFDENSFQLVLSENDTISDLLSYLEKRERLLQCRRPLLECPGEEELLGLYFSNLNSRGEHDFAFPEETKDADFIGMADNFFLSLMNDEGYRRKKKEDEISYTWDNLIEHFIRHRDKNTIDLELERGVRFLASENRLSRRELSKTVLDVLSKRLLPGQRYARAVYSKGDVDRAYLMLIMAPYEGLTSDGFQESRRIFLEGATTALKDLVPHARFLIGLGLSRDGDERTEHLLVEDTENWGPSELKKSKEIRQELRLFQKGANYFSRQVVEFPREEFKEKNISLENAIKGILNKNKN